MTGQFLIRPARPDDAEGILDIYAPIVHKSPATFRTNVPSVENIREQIEAIMKTHIWLVCENESKVAGYAYAAPHRTRQAYSWATEVTIYLGEEYRGIGMGKELYKRLFEILKKQGYKVVLAGISMPNMASERLHESMGFEKIGEYRNIGFKLGKWHSTRWFQRILTPQDSPPGDLIHWEKTSGPHEWPFTPKPNSPYISPAS